jgi:hypothetical protein
MFQFKRRYSKPVHSERVVATILDSQWDTDIVSYNSVKSGLCFKMYMFLLVNNVVQRMKQ